MQDLFKQIAEDAEFNELQPDLDKILSDEKVFNTITQIMPENIVQAYANIELDRDEYIPPDSDETMNLNKIVKNITYLLARDINYCLLTTCYLTNKIYPGDREHNFLVNIIIFLYRLSHYIQLDKLPTVRVVYDNLCSIDNKEYFLYFDEEEEEEYE